MAAARTVTRQQWTIARKHGHAAYVHGIPHILTQDTATGETVLVPVRITKPPRKRTPVLLHRDPSGIDGGTAILSDGSRVHFGPQMGAKLVIERRGEPGYEVTLATCEDIPEVAEWTRVIESADARRMTSAQHAAWNRAAAAVGYANVRPDGPAWTCTLSDGGGTAVGHGDTPRAAFRAADQQARRLAVNAGLDHPDDEEGIELVAAGGGYVVRYHGIQVGTICQDAAP
ncbi:MAG: hypothetical protein KF873_18955 [Gemmataceae bacterium]|nr:hypothetical protein [Gemmataceae bacterium]